MCTIKDFYLESWTVAIMETHVTLIIRERERKIIDLIGMINIVI